MLMCVTLQPSHPVAGLGGGGGVNYLFLSLSLSLSLSLLSSLPSIILFTAEFRQL